ncbi:topless-related protein 3-like [Castanea sativa]|uniref:topless-related protein 3-like n=1 Tax=Castanea sativa TaxID=21020 RepID=UPI003F64D037
MEDSTIHIYNVRVDEVKTKLKGHQKRITGLAFSSNLNVLVSTGADAQICFWNFESWEKRKSITIQLPAGRVPVGDTRVQFHCDQVRMLVCHETQPAVYDASKMERIRQGLDIIGVQTVINYECPREYKSYIHRVGRTARAGREGTTFVTDNDRSLLKDIAKKVGRWNFNNKVFPFFVTI